MQKSHFLIVTSFILFLIGSLHIAISAPVFNAPAVRIQPNGDTLHCYLSGDEYYHRLHDANGFTIIQHPRTGYWVYADTVQNRMENGEQRWELVATQHIAGIVNPSTLGISPNLGVDHHTWTLLQHRLDVPKNDNENDNYKKGASVPNKNGAKTSGRNHGTINNIVIFIRFSDETEISTSFTTINSMFNDSSASSTSMLNYFRHASYNKLDIITHYYPTPSGTSIVSYQDSLPRSYYMPYNATTAPNGYQDDTECRLREFGLLERAVNYINANYPVSTSINLDADNDGMIDNICFVVKGTYTGWSELLWPHKWSLYDRYVYINNKRVYTFNLQLEGSGSHYFSSSTFCHEMFHSLGAPDLYRYNNYTNVSGVGSWDLMCSNTTPPQHMSAYMKWKYGNWLDSIPEITVPGTYTLHSLADTDYDNCAYKIAAQEPNQWYVLEYRDNTELFETALPGKGLLIFRIDDRYNGNASFDGINYFDEVYLFRPNASDDTTNGNPAQGFFRAGTGRTTFSPSTNPHPWLTGNIIDTTISITDISAAGTTISFTYNDLRGCRIPDGLASNNVNGISASLSWSGNAPTYRLYWRAEGQSNENSTVVNGTTYNLTGLYLDTQYEWRLRAICSDSDSSDISSWARFHTTSCLTPFDITIASSDTSTYHMPINTYYNYTYCQMLYTPHEVGCDMTINKISFNYAGSNDVTCKDDCTIYLGYRADSNFASNTVGNLVPLSQLTKVYEGPLYFTTGWNTITLDSSFSYDASQCLVIAIDDNSGEYHGSSYKFSCTKTGFRYSTLSLYSDNENYNPSATTSSSSKMRFRFHPDIRFEGCPIQSTHYYYVTINNSNSSIGSVSGDGLFEEGSMATISAQPIEHHHFQYWSFPDGTTVTNNPYSFSVDSNITVTAHFSIDTHTIAVDSIGNGYISGNGSFPYGHSHHIYADPYAHNRFIHWRCNNTGEIIDEPVIYFNVTSDSSFTAVFATDRHLVEVSSDNPLYGYAWFSLSGSSEQLNNDSVEYGSAIQLYAQPATDDDEATYAFEGWSDGVSYNPRQITVKKDTVFTALFSRTERPVGIISADNSSIDIHVNGEQLTVAGAEGRTIELFDVTGRRIASHLSSNVYTAIMPFGVYIVKIQGLEPKKIVIR